MAAAIDGSLGSSRSTGARTACRIGVGTGRAARVELPQRIEADANGVVRPEQVLEDRLARSLRSLAPAALLEVGPQLLADLGGQNALQVLERHAAQDLVAGVESPEGDLERVLRHGQGEQREHVREA